MLSTICPAEADLQVLMLYVSQSVLHVQIGVRLRRTYVLQHILPLNQSEYTADTLSSDQNRVDHRKLNFNVIFTLAHL